MSRPPEVYLFDLDGVLRVQDPERLARIEARYGLPPGRIAELASDPERLGPALIGQITDEDWRMSVVVELVPLLGDAKRAVQCALDWAEHFGRVDPEVLEVVSGLRAAGRPVGLLANGTTNLERELAALGLLDSVDKIVNSARFGVAKPDADLYLLAAGLLETPPQRCLYVSARPELVAGAERTGMKGHLYDGVAGLRAMLDRLPTG